MKNDLQDSSKLVSLKNVKSIEMQVIKIDESVKPEIKPDEQIPDLGVKEANKDNTQSKKILIKGSIGKKDIYSSQTANDSKKQKTYIPTGIMITQEDRIKNQDKKIQYPFGLIP